MTDPIPMRPLGPHPTAEQLYHARGRQDEESKRLLRHAAGCALCSEEMARQEAFDQPEALPAAALEAAWERFGREPEARRGSPPRRGSSSRRAPLLALAAALTACVLGLGIWNAQRIPEPAEPADTERGAVMTGAGWSPTGALNAPPAELTFPNPQGEPRRVRVFDASQGYTWTSEPTTGGRIAFPEAERQRLRPGVEYFWTVLDGGEGAAARSFRIGR
ncbi:MAG TPA: hypothetical protein VKK31_12390 [Thermoanaerobaculia bacterium]|nr:hypothetical protein [Thermoanaerobaculia bacterium]